MSQPQLNPQQLTAVTHPAGPLLIVAGAGTGKTTVITERIKWLIAEQKVKPEQILALTFTEKAAAEMEERVDMALPLGYSRMWILTFHGFCERILREEALQIGLDPGFTIMSEAESQLFLKRQLFDLDLHYFRPKGNPHKFVAGMLTHFSRLKDDAITPNDYQTFVDNLLSGHSPSTEEEQEQCEQYAELARAYALYEQRKVEEGVMDFADLISNTLLLITQRPNVLARLRERFPYLLIDEFQDTNFAQNHLAIAMVGEEQHITVVADDDQSIYRWRGAAVYNVMDFRSHFPDVTVVTLNQNYRSRQEILDYSYDFIQHNNPDRLEVQEGIDKRLVSSGVLNDLPDRALEVIWEESVEDEAESVVAQIAKVPKDQLDQVAILVRANNHAEPFIRALVRAGIPYQFLGPGKLFKQPEILDLISYVLFLTDIFNNEALYRVLSGTLIHVSGRDLAWCMSVAREENLPLVQVIERVVAEQIEEISATGLEDLSAFMNMYQEHLDQLPTTSPGEMLYRYLQDTHQLDLLRMAESEQEVLRVENISAFFAKVKEYETLNPDARLTDFAEYISYLMEAGESPTASDVDWRATNAVNILTIHSSKGLEFDTVFLVNLVQQRFPSTNRKDQIPVPEEIIREPVTSEDPHLQEERRLFYVGVTRAKKKVYLTGAKFYHEGKRAKKISPFVLETVDTIEPYLVDAQPDAPRLFDIDSFAITPSPELPESLEKPKPVHLTTLSYSMISSFKTCPLHFKLEYLLKLPKRPTGATSFGNSVHNTLRDVYQLFQRNELERSAAMAIPRAMELFDQHWISSGFVSKEHEEEMHVRGKEMITTFLRKDLARPAQTINLEMAFNVSIAADLRIIGRIDRVDELPDGRIEIIDYKTGSKPSDKDLKKDLQLSMYAMAARHPSLFNKPLDQIILTYQYLETEESVSFERTSEELDAACSEIVEIRDQIKESDFTCSGGIICLRGCEYKLFCGSN